MHELQPIQHSIEHASALHEHASACTSKLLRVASPSSAGSRMASADQPSAQLSRVNKNVMTCVFGQRPEVPAEP